MSAQPAYPLRAERGGLAPASTATPRMSISAARALHIAPEILAQPGLSLLACAVLAEVIDLYQHKGQCFASDEHFAERCHYKPRTVRETIAELEAAGFLTREVNYAARHKRLLMPTEKWRNPPGVVADSATTTPEVVADSAGSSGGIRQELWRNPPGVVADSANINTILNTKTNTILNTTTPFGRGDAAPGLETFAEVVEELPVGEAESPAPAPKKKVAAKKKAPDRPSRPEVPFAQSELASVEAFCAAFAGTDWELADLPFYHAQVANWRQKGEPPLRKDWKATATKFLLNDQHDNRLKLAPGVQRYDPASHANAVGSGAGPTGYRSSRYD
jgi:hypothetical protein